MVACIAFFWRRDAKNMNAPRMMMRGRKTTRSMATTVFRVGLAVTASRPQDLRASSLTSVPLSPPTAECPVARDLLLASLGARTHRHQRSLIWMPRGGITAPIMPLVGFEAFLDADDEFAYRPMAGKPGTYLFFYPSRRAVLVSRDIGPAYNTWHSWCGPARR